MRAEAPVVDHDERVLRRDSLQCATSRPRIIRTRVRTVKIFTTTADTRFSEWFLFRTQPVIDCNTILQ
jgi:hypothetical protein